MYTLGYQITTEKILRYSIYTLPRNAGYHIILFKKSLLCKLTHALIYGISNYEKKNDRRRTIKSNS